VVRSPAIGNFPAFCNVRKKTEQPPPFITMLSQLTARTGRQVAARCAYSRSAVARSAVEPKLHNATGNWSAFKAKRPIDEEDLHVSFEMPSKSEFQIPNSHPANPIFSPRKKLVFHTPFNPITVIGMMTMVVGLGVGSMVYGVVHQQVRVNQVYTMKRFCFLRDYFSFTLFCVYFLAVQTRILEIERP
jgi:hypothetical protein